MSDNLIERPVIPLPDGFTWGFVTARSIHAMADTTEDYDRYPEARGSNGRAIFTPMVRFNKHTEDPTAFVQYEVARARIREGTLVDAEGQEGIWLITGDYDVTFQIDDGSIPGFPITVTEEYTKENPLDLVKYSPLEVPPGYVEIVRVIDRERAEDAAEVAEGYAEDARQFSQTETFEGYIASAESARDLANQYQLNASESATSATQSANQAEQARDATANLVSGLPDSFDDVATTSDVSSAVQGLASENYVDDRTAEINTAKGVLPDGTNVDNAYGEDWHGSWYLTSSTDVTGLPKNPDQGSVFEVVFPSSFLTGNKQIFSDRYDSYWREAGTTAGGQISSWGSWHRIASTEEVENAVSGLASESYVDSEVSNLQGSVVVAVPNLSEGDDLDDFLGNQLSYVNSSHSASIVNRPPDSPSGGATVIVYTGGSGTQNQEWTLNTGSSIGHKWVRSRTANSSGWDSWHKLVFEEDLSALTAEVNALRSALESLESASFRSRGQVPSGTDMNDMFGSEWRGIWWSADSSELSNTPLDFSGSTLIEIVSSDRTNACKQVVSTDLSSYWREARGMLSGSVSSWGDWFEY